MRSQAAQAVFLAIADPKRRLILEALARGSQTSGDLAKASESSPSATSQHLAVLEDVGLVTKEKQGRFRVYRMNAEPLKQVSEWTQTMEKFWQERLDKLKRFLEGEQ